MNKLVNKLTKEKHHLLLAVLLSIFIVVDVHIPLQLASLIDTIVGKTVVILIIFALIAFNKLVGVLAIIAGYMLVMRSMNLMGTGNLMHLENEQKKVRKMHNYNQKHNVSVEEEVIDNMLPRVSNEHVESHPFKPVQNNLHSAEKL
jgi:hypothetical protein